LVIERKQIYPNAERGRESFEDIKRMKPL
jgi:hypothetical protein